MPANALRARDLFLAVVDLPPGERAAALAGSLEPPAVVAEVERLLAAHAKPDSLFARFLTPSPPLEREDPEGALGHPGAAVDVGPATDATVTQAPGAAGDPYPAAVAIGTVVGGKYKLIEAIGEGGMGSVYMALQTEPVKRAVAVKVIKAGMDSKAVLARFEAERQALAMMDHPNIARVLDAGTTESGRPYFVMELVKGVPITQFCDERKLSPKQRLELFVPVCHAIQHAHQKGVIHRDIKPSNVLIALYDDKPVPKVIDFGVAKAAGQTLTDKTLMTGFGAVVGTPEYMSPEQASLNNLDIDTRSDVYSLGVLLYELLTGTTPVDRNSLDKAALLEILRIVREVEAPKPSHKLSTSDALPSISANRGTEPAKLSKLMKGELDWVLLKALEKDRTRRYDSANGFAQDIQRYLADEVVEARPPSTGYRLRKFVRRHKGAVIAAGLVLFALLAGVIGTTLGLLEARRQTEIAQSQEKEAKKQETEAIRQAGIAREEAGAKEQARAAAVAAAAAEKIAKQDAEAKKAEAETARQAEAERADGEKKAKEAAVRNLAFARKGNAILGSVFIGLDPKANYATIAQLRNALRNNLVKAVKELEGSAIGDPIEVAAMQNILGQSLYGLGESGLAIEVLAKARSTLKAKLGPGHPDTFNCTNSLAVAYVAAGKYDLAVPLHEETLELTKAKLGPDHPNTLTSMNNLAEAYRAAGNFDQAVLLHEKTLKLRKAKLGPNHVDTLQSENNLAAAYLSAGKFDLAPTRDEQTLKLEETLKLRRATLGPDHPNTLTSMNNLAQAYKAVGKLDLAVQFNEETLKLRKAKLGPDHPDTIMSMNNLAEEYHAAGKFDLAVPLHEEALKLFKAKLGPDHPSTIGSMANLGRTYCDANQGEKAVPVLTAYVTAKRKRAKPDDPEFAERLVGASLLLLRCDQFAPVEEMLRESLAIREKVEPDAWGTFATKSLLGGSLLGQKKYGEAEPLLLKGYEGMMAREKTIPPKRSTYVPEALDRLIAFYTATKKPDEVKKYRDLRAKYTPELAPPPRVAK